MASLFLLPPPHMKVVVRVRPMLAAEVKKGSTRCVDVISTSNTCQQVQIDDHVFDVDRVYDERINQRDFFHKEFSTLIPTLFDGNNVTVFACGASGSGKTFTMEGAGRTVAKNPGLVPRIMQKVFQYGQQQVANYRVEMSFVEVHNNKVMDFLAPTAHKFHQEELSLSTSPCGRVIVDNLIARHILSFDDFQGLYERACKTRRKGTATYHTRSSRSHSLLHVRVESRGFDGLVRVGHLHLVDLAGQDDICPTVQESACMMLDMQPLDEVPIARLLADSVAHSSIAVMVCTVSSASVVARDTLQVLQHAAKKQQIVPPTALPRKSTPVSSPPSTVSPSFSTSLRPTLELTPKTRPAASPSMDTPTPCAKRRRDESPLSNPTKSMKRFRLQQESSPLPTDQFTVGSNDHRNVTTRRLQPLIDSRVEPGRAFLHRPPQLAKESMKHLLTMAVDFEKRGKARPAMLLYMQATMLLDTPNEKLQARIRSLMSALPTADVHEVLQPSNHSVHDAVQHILEEDILDTFNHGSMAALMAFQSIGEKKAMKIIRGRDKVEYTCIHDLMKAGMGEKQVVRFEQLNVAARLSLL
ncbi:hypothetical protein H310_03386 [Aphanomyces invadans]|uniref:Kinesin motor domain-containing protein n=1 Tax=Aphanomyces invadans TaxID=157072 RepID=A0A024UH90_9STRA|nr:hypothetical protein H310_03386 [Aphanomyces invadans]ETW05664.1 hypothetical protein H310_03386 [Aphanomyces invadans]|eukprot:XP_008865441.1 hypothetical protein H310_03386 [Aphanomyces invadans]